ncbi:MAG: hypothetical protein K8R69_08340, partial [Deltaproteobacteria bacterium]|nr:hypothetical protein [Deltaproteobacteria bacterium]
FELAKLGANCSGEKKPWPYKPHDQEELLALAAEMSRFDPRLLSILAEYFMLHWREISPQKLRACYDKMETPQTLAVIAEFVKAAAGDPELRYFADYLQKGLKKLPFQLYFRDLYVPGGELSRRAADESLSQFKKWGFFARESPSVDVFKKVSVGSMDAASRINLLRRLFQTKKSLSLRDYMGALQHSISRQQALQDFAKIAALRGGRQGRGARWVLKLK